jgi:hypothetical protein
MPYGFPSGAKLRERLCNYEFMLELTRYGAFYELEIMVFCDAFLKSSMASIDAFLARRGDQMITDSGKTYAEVGKAGIALALMTCEKVASLHNFSNDDNWYHYLWQFLGDSLESLGENKLSIITFNYDRSLEIFLLLAIQNAFGVSEQVAAQHLSKIPIIHVYGQLGGLTCFSSDGSNCRPYTAEVSQQNIAIAANGIRVIAEHREGSVEFVQAQEALMSAERICFLGFGFDETNVRRLNILEILKLRFQEAEFVSPNVFATTLGMLHFEREKVARLLTAAGVNANATMPGFYRYESLAAKIRSNISEAADQKTTNYLRHTGVLNGFE